MFKTITVFHILDAATGRLLSPESLQKTVPEPTAADPDKTAWSRVGISKPDVFGGSTVFVGADNTRLINVQVRERMLPGKVIRKYTTERIAEIEERQGHKTTKKERAAIKDEVVASLLPSAFVRATDVLCMVSGKYLIIGTGSARLVDVCLVTLNSLFDNDVLNLRNLVAGREPQNWMFDLLDNGTTDSGLFNRGESVVMKDSTKATARFKDMDLDRDDVRDSLVAGMRPVEIAAVYDENLKFAITDQMIVKGIKFSDVLLNQVEEGDNAVDEFDATLAMVSGTLLALINDLVRAIPVKEEGEDEL